jgi:hypothetical protein
MASQLAATRRCSDATQALRSSGTDIAWSPGTSEDPQSAMCAVLFCCVTSWLADDPRDGVAAPAVLPRITKRRQGENSTLCLAGSAGAELFIDPVAGSRTVRKYRFDVWQSREFIITADTRVAAALPGRIREPPDCAWQLGSASAGSGARGNSGYE